MAAAASRAMSRLTAATVARTTKYVATASFSTGPSAAGVFRDIVQSRRTCRGFDASKQIPRGVIDDVLEATLRAPTSFNLQPYTVLLVTSPEAKAALADACLGQNAQRVQDAPLTAVFAADLQALQRVDSLIELERAAGAGPGYLNSLPFAAAAFASGPLPSLAALVRGTAIRAASLVTPMPTAQSPSAWAYKQTMSAASHFILSATAHGLATAAMEGLDAHRVNRALNIPDRYETAVAVSMGYATEADSAAIRRSPRFDIADMVRVNDFATPYTRGAADGADSDE